MPKYSNEMLWSSKTQKYERKCSAFEHISTRISLSNVSRLLYHATKGRARTSERAEEWKKNSVTKKFLHWSGDSKNLDQPSDLRAKQEWAPRNAHAEICFHKRKFALKINAWLLIHAEIRSCLCPRWERCTWTVQNLTNVLARSQQCSAGLRLLS